MANVLPDPSTVLPSTADRTFTSSNPTTNTVAGNPREFNLGSSVSPTLTTPTTSTGTVIPANNVTSPSTPINYATPTGATQSAMNALNAGNLSATQSLQSQFDNLNSIKTNSESQQNTLTNAINSLLEQTKGQAEATAQAEQNLGVNQKLADLQASKNKANLLQAQYDQSYAKLYDPNKPIELLTGEQAAFKAQAQADIGFANADVLAKTGDLELAQNLAKKAVDAKYAPIMESINIKQAQLKLLEPILKKEDATKLSVQNMALEKQKKENELKIQEEKDFQDTVAEASAGGATGSILEKARSYFNSGNKEQAYAALGSFGKKYLENQKLRAEIDKLKAEAQKARTGSAGVGDTVGTGTIISEEAQGYVDLINKGTMTLDEVLTKLGSTNSSRSVKAEIINAISSQGGASTFTTKSLLEAKNLVENMITNKDWTNAGYGGITGISKYTPGLASDFADATARASQLNALLAKDNLGLLKGAMSDNDLKFIQDMSGGATFKVSEKYAKERIESIKKKISDRITELGVDGTGNQSTQGGQTMVSTGNPKADEHFKNTSAALNTVKTQTTGATAQTAGYVDNKKSQ